MELDRLCNKVTKEEIVPTNLPLDLHGSNDPTTKEKIVPANLPFKTSVLSGKQLKVTEEEIAALLNRKVTDETLKVRINM